MYTRKLRCMDTLKELNIPKEDFVIYGSAPMVLRGLKEKNNDLDVLVRSSLWEQLSVKYPNNINASSFFKSLFIDKTDSLLSN